ncbi:MAG TPA: ABC transporter ATP-binding protein [Candidatus Tectomicrobia bacterium]|jgi:branched-chain amino acid transport system ATP-binding protein
MLQVRSLSVAYGDLPALRDVSFDVGAGELVALIGPNGAGKTTALKAVLGLLPCQAGTITLQGQSLHNQPPHRRVRLGLALVPEGRHIFPRMTVQENLELGAAQGLRAPSATLEWSYGLFPLLAERRKQLAGTLSGGQQQMLAIGRALMSNPRLLMLDEPSLGLAPLVVDQLYDTIGALKAEGLTILLVEQQVYGALELADRAYVLETGRLVREGKRADLLADDYIQKTYLAL